MLTYTVQNIPIVVVTDCYFIIFRRSTTRDKLDSGEIDGDGDSVPTNPSNVETNFVASFWWWNFYLQ